MLGVPTSLAILIFDSNSKYVISVYERRRDQIRYFEKLVTDKQAVYVVMK